MGHYLLQEKQSLKNKCLEDIFSLKNASRSPCALDLEGSELKLECDILSCYDDHKQQSYGFETNARWTYGQTTQELYALSKCFIVKHNKQITSIAC